MTDSVAPSSLKIPFDNTYVRDLPGFYVEWSPTAPPTPELLCFNRPLAEELGLDPDQFSPAIAARVFSGAEVPVGAEPIAQAYAGHQFGGFSPQLGDGRALLLGEVVDRVGRRRDIAFKGSGPTPFSRGGDGKAAVGPVLREFIIGEGLHALGIPTSRALAAVRTGDWVRRERPLPGAVLTRVAASHIRVGTFEYFAAREAHDKVRQLAEYSLARHFPEWKEAPDRYWRLLESVARRQAELLAQWMHVGFLHGVMNTDNMAISGESIDFGPCAFLEAYDPRAVFSSIDTHGRYSFRNQPLIARWNLARLAETLLPLFGAETQQQSIDKAMEVIDAFPRWFADEWNRGAQRKLGLDPTSLPSPAGTPSLATNDSLATQQAAELAHAFLELLAEQNVDFTLAWRRLADAAQGDSHPLRSLFDDSTKLQDWSAQWHSAARQTLGDDRPELAEARAAAMRRVSPLYVPRNHLVEEALTAASDSGNLVPFEELVAAISNPYQERPGCERFAEPAPRQFTACYKTFCGT